MSFFSKLFGGSSNESDNSSADWSRLDKLNPINKDDWDEIDYFIMIRDSVPKQYRAKLAFLGHKKAINYAEMECTMVEYGDESNPFRSKGLVEKFNKGKKI